MRSKGEPFVLTLTKSEIDADLTAIAEAEVRFQRSAPSAQRAQCPALARLQHLRFLAPPLCLVHCNSWCVWHFRGRRPGGGGGPFLSSLSAHQTVVPPTAASRLLVPRARR